MSSVEPSGAQTGVRAAGLTAQSPGADNGGAQQPDLASSSSTRAPRQTEPEPLASDRQDTSASALAESALNGGGEQAAARGESGPTDGTGETSSSSASREPNGSADTRSAGSTNTRAQRETAARSDATENTAAVALPGGVPQPFAESDSAAGSSTDQRAAPAQQIAGIVEAPGRTVTSHDVVVPQRLDGLLPMTLGVEGNGEFDFDRAVLRPEVKPRLDQLADQLSAAEYDRLDIVGHTDRIGATDYNQYLSERRAWAVARYLLARGVPQGKLHVEGRGTREPLTKPEECPFEAREQLIPCLQKDRRVEISASIRKADVEVQ
jgi:outer membrane protein OmpA-like peptidoglycan-associated protein